MNDENLFIALVLAALSSGDEYPVSTAKKLLGEIKQALKEMK